MSDSLNTRNFLAIDAGDPETTLNSSPIYTQQMLYASAQISGGTSTPNGTLKIYGSNDHGIDAPGLGTASVSNWVEVGTLAVTAAGNALAVSDLAYKWIKVNWTDSTSTAGTMSIRCTIKGW